MTNFRVFLLICSMITTVSVVMASTPDDEFVNKNLQQANLLTEQKLTVTGTIKDAATGETLPGVTIVVKGTSTGTISDANGKFSVAVTDRTTVLIFSFVGYTTQEITALIGTSMNVSLSPLITQISDVVVVGYGTQKKESVVGAITQVNNALLMKSGSSNITNAIAGKLSGVLTIQQTGEPGSNDAEIIVRGLSSWNGSAPLVLVDGVERDFSMLDPNEINTISVLKDASSTAVFGARGANGVIIVTSKRGSLGKPKFDFSASYGMQIGTRVPDHIDSYTTMKDLNVARMNGQQFTELLPDNILEEYRNPSTPLNALRYPNVNWYEEVTKPFAPMVNANVNVTGGTEFVKYFLSLGYQHQGDFFKGTKQGYIDNRYYNDKFNYRINVDFSLTKSTLLSLNVGGEQDLNNRSMYDMWGGLYSTSPARFPAYYPAWVLEQFPDPDYPSDTGIRFASSIGGTTGNPYSIVHSPSFTRYLNSTLFTDLIINQKLDNILKGLSFNGKVSLSTYYHNRALYAYNGIPDYQLWFERIGVDANKDGVVDQNPWVRPGQGNEPYYPEPYAINNDASTNNVAGLQGFYSHLYYEMSLNYANTWGKHTVSGLALFNRQQKNTGTEFPYYNEGLVGRATYDYSHKYLLEVNVGYTGSERFAPKNRFGFFPAAAVGWIVSEEQFFKNAFPWMNKLKVRYSDGLVGSDYANSRWLYTSAYYSDSPTDPTKGNFREDLAPNTSAQWEMAHKRDIGFEMGFFKNVFTLSVDLFDEYRNKMLLTPNSVTMLIGNSFKELNLGEVKKHGFEVEAEFRKTTGSNFEYFVRGIFGFNENRIIFKDDLAYAPEYMKSAGKPLGAQLNGVLLTGSGYYTSVDDIHNNIAPVDISRVYVGDYKFLDFTADGTITNLDRYSINGSNYPPITYSFSSGFKYKNFDFNFMFQGNSGKYANFGSGFENEFNNGEYAIHKSQLDYWSPTNPDANHSTLHYSGSGSPDILSWGDLMIKDRYFRNADYLRLKDVYVAYTFNSAFLKRLIGVSNLLVYATGNNLLTFTKLIEGDPEAKSLGGGFYPIMVGAKLGVKVVF